MPAFRWMTHNLPGHYPPGLAGILSSMALPESLTDESRAPLDVLLENHRVFLRYLQRRVGDPALAEDILQDSFIKVMDRPDEYAEALQAIDVQGTPVTTFAEQRSLSASNAGVRVFRAREALKKRLIESCGTCAEHGCQNCTCQASR
jgi:DNA-directed RNA polymerase specialized sigma24 family protein